MNTASTPSRERLRTLVQNFVGRKLLIVGDAIADRFLYGSISRVSREAPVFILKHEQTETVPGGAANCAMNLASLGATVSLVSVAGNDEVGRELHAKLSSAGVGTHGFILSEKIETTTKVRILAGQAHSNRQQVIRIDYEGGGDVNATIRQAIRNHLRNELTETNAVIISDYNYGVADEGATGIIRDAIRERSLPVLVDSRFRLRAYTGFTAATPNEDEVEQLTGVTVASQKQLEQVAEKLKQELDYESLLVTRGAHGMMLLQTDEAPLHINAVGAQQPVDVTGAGDTVIATFTLALSSGASYIEAAHLANYAGGLVVMKRGTACITPDELDHSILNSDTD